MAWLIKITLALRVIPILSSYMIDYRTRLLTFIYNIWLWNAIIILGDALLDDQMFCTACGVMCTGYIASSYAVLDSCFSLLMSFKV